MIAVRAMLSKAAPLLAVAGLLGIWQIAALILNTDSFPSALDGIRAIPAGTEMNVRTMGSIREKKTVASPQRLKCRSATSRSCIEIRTYLP